MQSFLSADSWPFAFVQAFERKPPSSAIPTADAIRAWLKTDGPAIEGWPTPAPLEIADTRLEGWARQAARLSALPRLIASADLAASFARAAPLPHGSVVIGAMLADRCAMAKGKLTAGGIAAIGLSHNRSPWRALLTGVTRTYAQSIREVRRVIDPAKGRTPFGIHVLVGQHHTVFMADTTVNERPTSAQLAEIAVETAAVARRMGHEPRVAFLSYSTFGNPPGNWLEPIRDAVAILDERGVNFEYEGEMTPDVALNMNMLAKYPFARLSGPANILVMPGLQSANLSAKLLRELGGDSVIGPMLVGMEKPVQIAPMAAAASELVTLAVLVSGGIVR